MIPINKRYWSILAVLQVVLLQAQSLVPVEQADGTFGVFEEGRFLALKGRGPEQVLCDGAGLAMLSKGRLELFGDRSEKVRLVESEGVVKAVQRAGQVVYQKGEALLLHKGGRNILLCEKVGDWSATEGLIVFHDQSNGTLSVVDKEGEHHALADVSEGSERPQWIAGPNTLVFHMRSSRRLMGFMDGAITVLADSTDHAKAAAGKDLVAFVDGAGSFQVVHKGRRTELSAFTPYGFQVGAGICGFVDMAGRLKVYQDGVVKQLTDTMPSFYSVTDSVLLFVRNGRLMTYHDGDSHLVEDIVPELWVVKDATIHYLDLNRGIRTYRYGERERVTKDGAYETFSVYGKAVRYPGHDGLTHIRWRDRDHAY